MRHSINFPHKIYPETNACAWGQFLPTMAPCTYWLSSWSAPDKLVEVVRRRKKPGSADGKDIAAACPTFSVHDSPSDCQHVKAFFVGGSHFPVIWPLWLLKERLHTMNLAPPIYIFSLINPVGLPFWSVFCMCFREERPCG